MITLGGVSGLWFEWALGFLLVLATGFFWAGVLIVQAAGLDKLGRKEGAA